MSEFLARQQQVAQVGDKHAIHLTSSQLVHDWKIDSTRIKSWKRRRPCRRTRNSIDASVAITSFSTNGCIDPGLCIHSPSPKKAKKKIANNKVMRRQCWRYPSDKNSRRCRRLPKTIKWPSTRKSCHSVLYRQTGKTCCSAYLISIEDQQHFLWNSFSYLLRPSTLIASS